MNTEQRDIANRMADVIVERIKAHNDYSKDDLAKAGFTAEEIKRYEPLAYGYASVQLHNQRSHHVA